MRKSRGYSLIELLVVVGIVAILLGLILPAARSARESMRQTQCAAHLGQLGRAFQAYAADHQGWMARYGTYGGKLGPIWMVSLARYLGAPSEYSWADLRAIGAFHCPSHPTAAMPTAFVVNAFCFSSTPPWEVPAGPTNISVIRRPAKLPWLLEAADVFNTKIYSNLVDDIFFEVMHFVSSPEHLPSGAQCRLSVGRHRGRSSNILYLDGHVSDMSRGQLLLESFDDGIRSPR